MNYSVIQKLGKASKIILKIMRIFLIIGFVLTFIGMVTLFAMPDFMSVSVGGNVTVEMDKEKMPLGSSVPNIEPTELETEIAGLGAVIATVMSDDTTLNVSFNAEKVYTASLRTFGLYCLGGLLSIAAFYILFLFAGRFAKSLELGNTPFTEENIKHLRNIGISALCAVLGPGIIMTLICAIERVGNIYSFDFNLAYIVAILFYIALVFIFRYGVNLENEKAQAAASAFNAEADYTPGGTDSAADSTGDTASDGN